MLQAEFLENLRSLAVRRKEIITRRRPADMSPFVVLHRGDLPAAEISIGLGQRNRIAEVMKLAALGFDADAMGLGFEGYAPGIDPATDMPYEHNPLTGEEGWGYAGNERGGMQILAEDHDGVAKGWVRECINVSAVNRAEDIGFIQIYYRYVGVKGHLSWGEETVWEASVSNDSEGYFVTVMLEAMRSVPSSVAAPHYKGDRVDKDLDMALGLTKQGNMVKLFAERGSDDAARIAEHGFVVGEMRSS